MRYRYSRPLVFFRPGLRLKARDRMQTGYSYILTEEPGKNFAPEFKPEVTPGKMLELGVFEGHYLNDCTEEFPAEWFLNAAAQLSPRAPDESKNCFGVKSRLGRREWKKRGWITPFDPDVRGWFQWYCRYWLGRREPELDERQIKRWKAFARHKAQILKNCPPGDLNCRPRQRQALLQWAYNPFI